MQMMALLKIIVLIFLSAAAHADYSEFKNDNYGSFIKFSGMPNALFFFEEIKEGDSFELLRALRDKKIDTIVLDSPGGLVKEGLQLASIINQNGLTTYIPKNRTCASACSYMFLAGRYRISEGALGVHQISASAEESSQSAEIGKTQEISQYIISQIVGFLTDFDTPPFVFEKMFQQQEMYYFSQSELSLIQKPPPILQRGNLIDVDQFLLRFESFLGLIECIDGSIACTDQQLCEIVYKDGEYSEEHSVKNFYAEIQKQGLNCRLVQIKAKPPKNEQELTTAIQNELTRLGCFYDQWLMDLVEGSPAYPGVVDWESIDALHSYLNADRNVETDLVSYGNLNFLYRLVGISEAICRKKIQIYVDEMWVGWSEHSKISYGDLPIEIQELNDVPASLRRDLLGPFDIGYVEAVKKFDSKLDWEKLSKEGISYVVMLKRSSAEPMSITTDFKIYDVDRKMNLSSLTEMTTRIIEKKYPPEDSSISANYRHAKKLNEYIRSLIFNRRLKYELLLQYTEKAREHGIQIKDHIDLLNEGIWMKNKNKHDACYALNELTLKYPTFEPDYVKLILDEIKCEVLFSTQ